MIIKFKSINPWSKWSVPQYQTPGAAGFDLTANMVVMIPAGGWAVVPTGLSVEIPAGWEGQVRSRSGLAAKNGIAVLNSPGTIDSDFRGEIKVILMNHGSEPFEVSPGDRIAQMVLAQYTQADFQEVEQLSDTDRGAGGFGSTGVKP